jgi:hypothetical protein
LRVPTGTCPFSNTRFFTVLGTSLKSFASLHVTFSTSPSALTSQKSNFKGPLALEVLNFNKNNIPELNDNVFEDLSSLTELHLANNKLKKITIIH